MSLQAFVSGSVQTLAILRLWRLSEMQEVYQGEHLHLQHIRYVELEACREHDLKLVVTISADNARSSLQEGDAEVSEGSKVKRVCLGGASFKTA